MLIMGSITEFSEKESGGGVAALSRKVGVGGVGLMKAHVGIIVRIVNAQTGEIFFSKSIERKVTKVGAVGGTRLFGMPTGGLFFKSKAMQDAVEELIIETTAIISEQKDAFSPASGSGGVASKSEIIVHNVNFSELTKLTNILKSESGVSNVQKSLDGNTGRITLQHQGSLDDLAEMIMNSDLNAEITGFKANKLELIMQ